MFGLLFFFFFKIKLENMIKRCSCAGEFRHLINREEIVKLFKAFRTISEQFNMPCLLETVDGILQLM